MSQALLHDTTPVPLMDRDPRRMFRSNLSLSGLGALFS
jgi:hypothetical protein